MKRTLTGLAGVLIVVALVLASLWALLDTYLIEAQTTYLLPTVAAGVVAFVFAFGLFVLGARSDNWLHSPYW